MSLLPEHTWTDSPHPTRRPGFLPMTSPPPSAALPNRNELLAALRASEILTRQQLARAEAVLPTGPMAPAQMARALVEAGLLTRFQADRFLAGRSDAIHFGPYLLQDEIGRGSMGKVFQARHRRMNRTVAVKVLAKELTQPPGARAAIQHELQAAAQLNHPNIVTAYDVNELGSRFYLVLEYVNGPSLAALVAGRGPLPVAEACELARQAALGLEHAHARGMVHRDINPKNLLVTRTQPVVKINDFGLARFNPSEDLDYVAPEQARHPQAIDPRSDLYSLGAILYFLLTGSPPFPGGPTEGKVHRHMWDEPVPIESVRSDVPAEVIALVRRLMAKLPDARPATAGEVAARLGALTGTAEQPFLRPAAPLRPASPESMELSSISGLGVDPAPTPASETSPWAALTVPNAPGLEDETREQPRVATPRTAVPGWVVGGLALGMLAACMAAVGIIVRAAGQ